MSQARRERREQERLARKTAVASLPETAASVAPSPRRDRRTRFAGAGVGIILLAAGVGWSWFSKRSSPVTAVGHPPVSRSAQPAISSTPPPPATAADQIQPLTLGKLTSMKPEELAGIDVATMNLLCAQGLPGSEGFDMASGLRTLDEWAHHVEEKIAYYHYRFVEHPAEYENKENLFKVVMLILTLQQDLGVQGSWE